MVEVLASFVLVVVVTVSTRFTVRTVLPLLTVLSVLVVSTVVFLDAAESPVGPFSRVAGDGEAVAAGNGAIALSDGCRGEAR